MKNLVYLSILSAGLLMACGNSKSGSNTSDTSSATKKADTNVVSSTQKPVKSDSIGGDPAAKGSEDPTNAQQPKK